MQRLNDGGRAIFAPNGELPAVGAILRNPALARTLRAIADGGADAFYRGAIADRLAAFIEAEGGYLRADDFRQHEPEWVEPLSVSLSGGRRAWAMPPNSQGFVQLAQLVMSEQYDLARMQHNSADYLHTLIEVKKLAFADRDRWLADPVFAPAPLERLLDTRYLQRRATLIGTRAAQRVPAGVGEPMHSEPQTGDGDTVYLMAVDAEGNAVSYPEPLEIRSDSPSPRHRGSRTAVRVHPEMDIQRSRGKRCSNPDATDDLMATVTCGHDRTPGGHGQSQFLTQVYHTRSHSVAAAGGRAPRYIHDGGRAHRAQRARRGRRCLPAWTRRSVLSG